MRFASVIPLPPRALLILALSALAAAQPAQTTRLKLGKAIPGDVSGAETRSYSIKLKANEYMRAVVTQVSPTVLVELHAPDGKKLLEIDTRQLSKPCVVAWIAEAAGELRISVSVPGQTQKAWHYEIKLQELRKARPDDAKRVEAEGYLIQGISERNRQTQDQAIVTFTRALGLYRELRDREREADALTAVGAAYSDIGQGEKAIGYYEQALAVRREIKDRRGEADAVIKLGLAYMDMNEYERAIGYYEQALAIGRETRDRRGEANALNNLGIAYQDMSQHDKAIGYYEQALPIKRELKDRFSESMTLINIGGAYMALSRNEKAIGYFEQALAVARELKRRGLEDAALNNLGAAYSGLSQHEKAIGFFVQALANARELKTRVAESRALTNLGSAYSDVGQYEKAIGYQEQALAIAREFKDRRTEGAGLTDLGEAYTALGQYEKAIECYDQALAIAIETKDRYGEAIALKNRGQIYDKVTQYEKAIGNYERALTIVREIKDRSGEGGTLSYLGGAYYGLSLYEKAADYCARGLGISREVKDRTAEAEELSGLMDTWQASGVPRLAIFYGKQTVNTVQSIRSDIAGLSQDLQKSFLKGNEKPYHTLAEILIAQGRLAEAEQVLALLKEEEYFQYIRRDAGEASSLNRRADLTPEEAEYEQRYREIGDRLMTIGVERGDLLAKKTLTAEQSQRLATLEQNLATGNQAFEHFLGDLTQHFSAKPEMTGRIDTLRETQGIMEDLRELPAGTVAIFTLIAEDKFYAILRTPDAEKAYEYPIKAAELNAKISAFRQVILDPKLDPRPFAQELYKILIGGMADDLRQAKAKTLMWSLDGALRYVPLAALYDGKQFLIEQYRVSVMTLASNTRLKDAPDAEWKAAGFGVTKGFEDASALPSVSSELTGIIRTKPGDGGVLAGEIELDEQFTQQAMRQMLLKRYPVVHIASHFRFEPGNDTKSFLLLGDGGHLTLAELKTSANLFGGVQLLTLSACNTGVGDGAEVEGFGTLAQRQGAKAVVASLWPVVDESTALLMREFYRIRESSTGTTKLEALREAQLALLRGEVQVKAAAEGDRGVVANRPASGAAHPEAPDFPLNANAPYAHPFYWAPFFLMGNWL